MKILVERSISQKPKAEGSYCVCMENDGHRFYFTASWNEHFSFHEDGKDCSGITSWFEERELPEEKEIKSAAENFAKEFKTQVSSEGMENIESDFIAGVNLIMDKLK